MRHCQPISIRAILCFLAVGCLLQTGCVRRRLMIRSNPPGAMAYVDNQAIGKTPCATDFIYYGTREIRLVKAGYETLTVNQPLPAPWYQVPPLDFVSENVVPRKIQDYRTASFNMVPQVIVPTEQLIARGEQLRQSTLQGAVMPANTGAVPMPVLPPGAALPGVLSGVLPGVLPSVLPPGVGPGQPVFVQPTLGQPTLAPPAAGLPAGVIAPPVPGAGTLPIGGQPLQALPAPQR